MKITFLVAVMLAGTCSAGERPATSFDPRALEVPAAIAAAGSREPAITPQSTELRFAGVFKLPIGPRGLEPSERLRQLDGQAVRMVGHMVARTSATPGQFILSPVPVLLGDEDESFADDVPASAVFIHLPARLAAENVVNLHGLIRVNGILRVGARDESDGRVSAVRIELDDATARWLPLAPRRTAQP